MEIFYRTAENVRVRALAIQNLRRQDQRWEVGGVPLEELDRIDRREWLLGGDGPEWVKSAEAMIR
jgi:hypothetical protein